MDPKLTWFVMSYSYGEAALIENCYVHVNVLKRDAFFDLFYLFSIILNIFANTGRKTRLFL